MDIHLPPPRSAGRETGRRPFSRWLGTGLVAGGAVLLAAAAFEFSGHLQQQQQLNQRFLQELARTPGLAPGAAATAEPDALPFAIDIPKLGYFAAVQEGVDLRTLSVGPGHYPGTAWSGQKGNVGVAAHNGYWMRFSELERGDTLLLGTRAGSYRYVVVGRQVVDPSDRSILAQTNDRRLTLTTCWPLWAGALARQRLVITAVLTPTGEAGGGARPQQVLGSN